MTQNNAEKVDDSGAKKLRETAATLGAKAVYFFNGVCGMRLIARASGVTYIGTDGYEHLPPADMRPDAGRIARLLANGRHQRWGRGDAACDFSLL